MSARVSGQRMCCCVSEIAGRGSVDVSAGVSVQRMCGCVSDIAGRGSVDVSARDWAAEVWLCQ